MEAPSGVPARGNTTEGALAAKELVAGGRRHRALRLRPRRGDDEQAPDLHPYRGVAQPSPCSRSTRSWTPSPRRPASTGPRCAAATSINPDHSPRDGDQGLRDEPGSYVEALDRALELVDYDRCPSARRSSARRVASSGWASAPAASDVAREPPGTAERGVPISSQEGCQLRVDPSGKVYARSVPQRRAKASRLRWPGHRRRARRGHRRRPRDDGRHGAARLTGRAPGRAAAPRSGPAPRCGGGKRQEMREKLLTIAAHLLEADPADLELSERAAPPWPALLRGTFLTVLEVARDRVLRVVRSPARYGADAGGGAPLRPAGGHALELDPRGDPRGRSRHRGDHLPPLMCVHDSGRS